MSDDQSAGEAAALTSSGGTGGGTSKLVVIASLVNMLATIGIVVVLLLSHQKEQAQPTVDDIVKGQAQKGHGEAGGHGDAKASAGGHGESGGHGGGHGEAKAEHGGGGHGGGHGGGGDGVKIVNLDPFTVNLTTGIGTSPRYVRMNMSVELEQGVPDKEFEVKLPRVRDTVINLLNSKKAVELSAIDGREQFKDEVKRSINGFMQQSKVKGVYITNFAISN